MKWITYISALAALVFIVPAEGRTLSFNSALSGSSETRRQGTIDLGIDVLAQRDFDILAGKRVGLLTHPAGVNKRGVSTVEILHRSPRVNLVALFGPEHGIYGDEKADVKIPDRVDRRTGLPVFSLYGDTRKPTPQMLDLIDVLVIDLQDIGTRSYTFISCMRLAVQACFEENKEVVILDRPNPLGGLKVCGPMHEQRWFSYVGAFQVPYVHGMTIGELARMLKEMPGALGVPEAVRRKGQITIVPMRGWQRRMLWPQTGLAWVPTSPAIPDFSAVLGYPMTGLGCQLGAFRHGYGTDFPFRLLTFPGRPAAEIKRALDQARIPGLSFQVLNYRMPNGQTGTGVYIVVDDFQRLRPTELNWHLMRLAARWSQENPFAAATPAQADLFNKHVGSTAWWQELTTRGANVDVEAFVRRNMAESRQFQDFSRRFWIYQ